MIKVPDTVTINGTQYLVTRIMAGALAGNDEIKKVVIGENVSAIGSKAFANCSSLKKIIIDGGAVKTIGKKAFKGIADNAVIKVDGTKNQVKAIKKLLASSGLKKTVKIKRI